MSQKIFVVDAFTSSPFTGNPAAVCVLDQQKEDEWMQLLAREMNLAETAFLQRENGGYRLRWFTPVAEVELCGHATLSAAHVLWERFNEDAGKELHFHTLSGILKAKKEAGKIMLDFPTLPVEAKEAPEHLLESIGLKPLFTGKSKFDYFFEVESDEAVKQLNPDFNLMKKIKTRGVIVTAKSSNQDYDFISRFFCPGLGIDEDPVTGSAHCALGEYWSKKLGKNKLKAYQASPRGGEMVVEVDGERTYLLGNALTVMEDRLLV